MKEIFIFELITKLKRNKSLHTLLFVIRNRSRVTIIMTEHFPIIINTSNDEMYKTIHDHFKEKFVLLPFHVTVYRVSPSKVVGTLTKEMKSKFADCRLIVNILDCTDTYEHIKDTENKLRLYSSKKMKFYFSHNTASYVINNINIEMKNVHKSNTEPMCIIN
jgi:hypothetical protein